MGTPVWSKKFICCIKEDLTLSPGVARKVQVGVYKC